MQYLEMAAKPDVRKVCGTLGISKEIEMRRYSGKEYVEQVSIVD